MEDISGVILSFVRNPRDALVFGLTNIGLYKKYIINITKMRKFMSKFVSKGNYVSHILKMNNIRGSKLAKNDAIVSAINHYKQLDFCKYCWLDNNECYCNSANFNYMKPELSFEQDILFINVDNYFARLP